MECSCVVRDEAFPFPAHVGLRHHRKERRDSSSIQVSGTESEVLEDLAVERNVACSVDEEFPEFLPLVVRYRGAAPPLGFQERPVPPQSVGPAEPVVTFIAMDARYLTPSPGPREGAGRRRPGTP